MGGHVFYYRQLPLEAELPEPACILFEDELLVVADKPHFMPVTPSGPYVHNSLLVQMKQQTQCETLTPLHRIDRETAGLVVFCKRSPDRDAYHALFRQQQVHKLYEAVAPHLETLELPSSLRCRLEEDERFFLSRVTSGEPNSETTIEPYLLVWHTNAFAEFIQGANLQGHIPPTAYALKHRASVNQLLHHRAPDRNIQLVDPAVAQPGHQLSNYMIHNDSPGQRSLRSRSQSQSQSQSQ